MATLQSEFIREFHRALSIGIMTMGAIIIIVRNRTI